MLVSRAAAAAALPPSSLLEAVLAVLVLLELWMLLENGNGQNFSVQLLQTV